LASSFNQVHCSRSSALDGLSLHATKLGKPLDLALKPLNSLTLINHQLDASDEGLTTCPLPRYRLGLFNQVV